MIHFGAKRDFISSKNVPGWRAAHLILKYHFGAFGKYKYSENKTRL
jgi:hypothetical protein